MSEKIFPKITSISDTLQIIEAINRSSAVAEFSVDGIILSANENFIKIFGYSRPDEVIGKHHKIFMGDDFVPDKTYIEFWNNLKNGRFVAGEFKRQTRLHKEVWIRGSYNPVFNEEGKPFKIIKYAIDISIQKNLSINLEEQHRAIDRSNAIAEFDMEGKLLYANRNYLDIFSYQFDEIKGKHHRMFLTDEIDKEDYEDFWARLRRGEFQTGEFKRVTRLGKTVWIRGSYNPILDVSGKPYKVIKFALDFTENKRLFNTFEEQLRAINKSNAVIEFDLKGNILFANDNFLDIFEFSLDELIGRHHSTLLYDGEEFSEEYKEFWASLGKGEYRSGEFKRRTRLGKAVWIRGSYNPILNENGIPEKIIKFSLDVTKQKELEQAISQERLNLENSSKLAALGEMAAGIAHEINNPLTIILCKVDESLEDFDHLDEEGTKDGIKKSLHYIRETSLKISRIVKGLRSFGRSGEADPMINTDMHQLFENITNISTEKFKKLNIDFRLKSFSGITLHCREVQVSQVIINLLNNSIDAVANQPEKWIAISHEMKPEGFVISVTDSGPGIPEHLQKKILEPFFTTKEAGKGTGLGLSISYEILRNHGGELRINTKAKNTCFELVFPHEEVKAKTAA